MSTKVTARSFVIFGVAAVALSVGFVIYPGCATETKSSLPAPDSPQFRWYNSAMSAANHMKARGELPGVEATAPGSFVGTWLWYDNTPAEEHLVRVVFHFS